MNPAITVVNLFFLILRLNFCKSSTEGFFAKIIGIFKRHAGHVIVVDRLVAVVSNQYVSINYTGVNVIRLGRSSHFLLL